MGHLDRGVVMTVSSSFRRSGRGDATGDVVPATLGALLVGLGAVLAIGEHQAIGAAVAGALGLALWRQAAAGQWRSTQILFDLAAFAIFAAQRNDGLAFWQLVGPWADAPRFNVAGASIAILTYILGALAALGAGHRALRVPEAASLLALPFLFNGLVVLGADWHMAEIGNFALPGNRLAFPGQVFVGRALLLFGISEIGLGLLSVMTLNRLPTEAKLHGLILASAALGAATPLIANFAQATTQPIVALIVGAGAAAIAQAGLWGLVYVATGLPLDTLAGRKPTLAAVYGNWRIGLIKGAIYGGLFMALILASSMILAAPGVTAGLRSAYAIAGPLLGALSFPFLQTLIGSADGTPPFFGRLRKAYSDRSAYGRGLVIGAGGAGAYALDLPAADGGARFLFALAVGALAYAGVDMFVDARRVARGERVHLQTWRKYALGAALGGIVAGAIGWYFDVAQVAVVVTKFWAYADVDYRVSGRRLGDFITYPIFNKYGSVNLGEVAGGTRLFWAESVSGVINWSLAAPLFSINYVLLAALLERSVRPFRELLSARGMLGLVDQGVRVMRWGLWMAPIINTFLRQSPDPSWYNQDGAVRSLVAIGADIGMSGDGFRDFSLTMFLGLLAYDWVRVLIWFDHMGLRVATLVNLSFLGGDRADEAAGRFLGHGARTRAIPDGIRRFGTWAPLLIPFYIPRGGEWDKAWTGAETLSHGGAAPGAVKVLAVAYGLAALAMVGASVWLGDRVRARRGAAGPALAGAPETMAGHPSRFVFSNGAVWLEVWRDGRGAAGVTADGRGGFAIDLIRRPHDPLQPRGHFFYLSEAGGAPWSIGFEPARLAGDYSIEAAGFNRVRITHVCNDVRATMLVGPDASGAVLSWSIRLEDLSGRARRLRLTSFCEIAGHESGHYARDLDFAGMHVETVFVRGLSALFARNRLLRSSRAGRGETSFFAVKPGAGVELVGYEDSRTRFLGEGSMRAPTGCEDARWRRLDDQGKLWTFDPAASFSLEADVAAHGSAEAEFVIGRADNAAGAAQCVASRLGLPELPAAELDRWFHETRAVEPSPGLAARWPFAFSDDGASLHLTHRTPRPWAHVMANELGASVVVANDGDVYSAFGNARHSGLTAFRFDSATTPMPGQIVYVRDLDAGVTDSLGFAPFQRNDAPLDITYEPGVATFRKQRGDLATICEIFVPPDYPGDMRLLTLANRGARAMRLRVVPFFDMALDESPNESAGHLESEAQDGVLLFRNRRNDFQHGFAFAATSLAGATTETIRRAFFGAAGRDITSPVFVETGASDGALPDDGRRVAAFGAEITLAPGEEMRVAIVLGMAATSEDALLQARAARVDAAQASLAATRAHWAERLGRLRIETNRPDFDRLVNVWLPYQLYASRLFGRVGPNQRGGACGYRDQLQDVLPLILLEPRLARAQIVLHAGQQFLEGDVLKWWHRAPGGGTGVGQRTRASDPHLWLPHVLTRYVEQTGDTGVLDVLSPYLEGPPVPEHEDTLVFAPRPSRETGSVYEHARRAIQYTFNHIAANGLPLLGAGDWNDGIDALGREGRGSSTWMGFFFYDVLVRFAPLARAHGDSAFAQRCEAEATKLRAALEVSWQGDHYGLDFADDGRAISMPDAMTTGWSAWSGAVEGERAIAALEGGLKGIERPDRILLLQTPFFEHSQPYPGRIADYPPGVRENGGQYSHGASWIVDGFLRVAGAARAAGDAATAARLEARAFEMFEKISPLGKTDAATIATYGLIPIQQPADIYDGYGHGGRGGWSWYTGSAARMLSAAYGLVGVERRDGEMRVADDAFLPKGGLQLRSIRIGAVEWRQP